MEKRTFKYISQICLWAGFLLPFVVSHYVGMALSKYPLVSAANIVLWVAGLAAGYVVYAEEKKFAPTAPVWIRICSYMTSIPATFVMLGLLFGFLYYPSVEKSIIADWVNYMLMLTLFVMGVQITNADWKGIFKHPKIVSVSVIVRWVCMPLVALILGRTVLLNLLHGPAATTLFIGLIVLATTPTGAASNTLTLISRGDLALSVSVTTVNTLLAPFLQPILIKYFVGQAANVNVHDIFWDLVKIILIPVIVGTVVGSICPSLIKKIKPALLAISVICLGLIIMANMSKGTAVLLKQIWILPVLAVVLLVQGFVGLSLGYWVPKLAGFTHKQRVAACFEVGVENASLSMVVARNHFSPLAAIPAVLYGKIQNLLAISVFVSRFQKMKDEEAPELAMAQAKTAAG